MTKFIYSLIYVIVMSKKPVQLGSRKIQKVCRSLLVNIPRVAADTLDLEAGGSMNIVLMPDDSLRLVKE